MKLIVTDNMSFKQVVTDVTQIDQGLSSACAACQGKHKAHTCGRARGGLRTRIPTLLLSRIRIRIIIIRILIRIRARPLILII